MKSKFSRTLAVLIAAGAIAGGGAALASASTSSSSTTSTSTPSVATNSSTPSTSSTPSSSTTGTQSQTAPGGPSGSISGHHCTHMGTGPRRSSGASFSPGAAPGANA
jgi:hypothetical protein